MKRPLEPLVSDLSVPMLKPPKLPQVRNSLAKVSDGNVPDSAVGPYDRKAAEAVIAKLSADTNILLDAAGHSKARGDLKSYEEYTRAAQANETAAQIYRDVNTRADAIQYRESERELKRAAHRSNPFDKSWSYNGSAAAGFDSEGIPKPNYFAINGSFLGYAGGAAISLDDGSIFVGAGKGIPHSPGVNAVYGYISGNTARSVRDAGVTAEFLGGAGVSGGVGRILYIGGNHSIGGRTALEIGLGTPGAGVGLGYSHEIYRGKR